MHFAYNYACMSHLASSSTPPRAHPPYAGRTRFPPQQEIAEPCGLRAKLPAPTVPLVSWRAPPPHDPAADRTDGFASQAAGRTERGVTPRTMRSTESYIAYRLVHQARYVYNGVQERWLVGAGSPRRAAACLETSLCGFPQPSLPSASAPALAPASASDSDSTPAS